jgi:hypothetical protein
LLKENTTKAKQLPQMSEAISRDQNGIDIIQKIGRTSYSTKNGKIKSKLIVKKKELLITFLRLVV